MNDFNDMLGKITEFLKSEAKTETIMGQPFKLDGFTCVPVMSIGFGFGGGGGEGKGTSKTTGEGEGIGAGVGAGMGIGPVGFLVTKSDEIQFISTKSTSGFSAAFEKMPGLIEKFLDKTKKRELVEA